ncbi:transcription termination factor rho family protein [Phormidium sp. FACHB-1136]|uniref:transcription termination factor rho family protein n=1 Tax=Phormidium sp. FACHB-1136 TaxID=2692848 RepID=UPI0016878A20|nr:transcription termination factor rho family protein [Phormidium sp. FACHB-1136]MBD2428392.1 transcription termination factor rho family protein [Phormidium sp. FACHB-1136]
MALTDVGNLMLLHFDEIEPGNPIEIHEYVIQFAAKKLGPEGRNWIPIIVKETGPDQYQVIGNSFIYAVAAEAGLEKVWCIIAEDSSDAVKISQALAQEVQPKTNLSTADRDEIAAALDYLIKQPGTPLKGVRAASVVARLDDAPREYWKDLKPITKLGCGITGGAKLKSLEQVFYLTPQPIPEITTDTRLLEMMAVGELKAMAKKKGLTGFAKLKKPDLIKLLSEASE